MTAILEDAARLKADQEKKPEEESLIVPLLMQNKVPSVGSSGDGDDAEGHPDQQPSVSDMVPNYDSIQVEKEGTALLGMGWEKSRSIGRSSKEVCKPVEFLVRPRRLGLGASPGPPAMEKIGGKEGRNAVSSKGSYIDEGNPPHKSRWRGYTRKDPRGISPKKARESGERRPPRALWQDHCSGSQRRYRHCQQTPPSFGV